VHLLRYSKNLTFLDLRHNCNNFRYYFNNLSFFFIDFSANTLETIRLISQQKNISIFLDPQNKSYPLESQFKSQNPNNQSGFLSERLKTESWKNFSKLPKRRSPKKNQTFWISNFLMTRMNWLIELKILFEKVQPETSHFVFVNDLLKIIEDHIKDFVLIEESVYKSTHSEIGLSPLDIIDSLRKFNYKNISYDDLFNIISQISHDSQKKERLFQETKKNESFFTESSDKPTPFQIIQNNFKPNPNENVRSSCEHIIETARFNKPEEGEKTNEEKDPPKPKTPIKPRVFKHENANSPLSFSMSAIQMTDSKTFTLSDFGGEFLNRNFNDSGKNLKSSTSKSSSLTRILNYESRKNKEEETVIRKKKGLNKFVEDQSEFERMWKKGLITFGNDNKEQGVVINKIKMEDLRIFEGKIEKIMVFNIG